MRGRPAAGLASAVAPPPPRPFPAQVQGGVWLFSPGLCDALMAMDVMLCTASIFHLCAISVDR